MIIIWSLSVLSLAIIASLFKLLMYSAGMRTHNKTVPLNSLYKSISVHIRSSGGNSCDPK
nr:DUF2474 domain-containing protein [Proteus mirabilis]